MKARHPQRRGEAASTAVTALLALIFFLPVLIAVINSFKTNGEILASAIALPETPTLENYKTVIEASDFPSAFLGSCLVTGGGIVLNLVVSSLAGYALALEVGVVACADACLSVLHVRAVPHHHDSPAVHRKKPGPHGTSLGARAHILRASVHHTHFPHKRVRVLGAEGA